MPAGRAGVMSKPTVSFSPASLTGLRVWYDASNAGSITESGGLVSQWNDLSGNGKHLISDTTKRPLTASSTQNGLNTLTFDGTNDQLIHGTAADWIFLHDGVATHFMYAVYKRTGGNASPFLLGTARWAGGQIGAAVALAASGAGTQHYVATTSGTVVINLVNNTSLSGREAVCNMVGMIGDPANATASLRSTVRVNSATASGSNAGSGTPTGSAALNGLSVGVDGTSTGGPFGGNICEIVIGVTLLAQERTDLESYLTAKWGIT